MLARALPLSAFALIAMLPTIGGAQTEESRDRRGEPGVAGIVKGRETRRPLRDVAITMRALVADGDSSPPLHRVLTDDDGRFAFQGLDDGLYRIEVERFGYRPVVESLSFMGSLGLRIEVEMVPEAVELDPLLVVTEARSRNLENNGYYDRRRRGIGRFVSRDEAVVRNAFRVSDVFRRMPGVRMSSTGRLGDPGVVLLRGGCVADVYIDGIRTVSPFPVDQLLSPQDLDAVEVYHGSEVPVQFGAMSCGVVVIWTHVPNPRSGQGWSWKKLLLALGFAGSVLLFAR